MSSDGIPATLLRHFDVSAPYPHADEISARRPLYPSGQLFFDRLLQLADTNTPPTDWASLYPPSSPSAQRKLLQAIHDLPTDRLKRDCFVYYLLRDLDNSTSASNDMEVDGSRASSPPAASKAAAWGRRRCIPRAWHTLMDGYWDLDHGRWDSAVAALMDPAIFDVNFQAEIVDALATLVAPPAYALQLVDTLLSVRPPAGAGAADAALLAAAGASMLEAFSRIRAAPPGERAAAREAVWCWALGAPRSPAGKGAHTAQPRALKELLHLVLSDEEAAHLVHFLAHPPRAVPAPARSLLHDLVTLRLIHAGKYEETLALDRELSDGGADRQRRREMVREFIDILPAAQRRVLLGDAGERDWVVVEAEEAQPEPSNARAPSPTKPSAPAAPATPLAAPTPVRPSVATRVLGTPARSASGFGGPPRFAESPRIPPPSSAASQSVRSPSPSASGAATPPPAPAPARRQPSPSLVASPFHPPAAAKPAPARKQPRKILDDDTPRSRRVSAMASPAPAPVPSRGRRRASPSPTPTATGSEMDVDGDEGHEGHAGRSGGREQETEATEEPESEPEEKPRLRRSTRRQSSEPPEPRYSLRAPSEAPSEPVIPEDGELPAPARRARAKRVVQPAQPKPKRTTRAASRASTGEPDEEEEMPPPKIPGAFELSPKAPKRGTKAKAARAAPKKKAADEDEEDTKAPARRSAAKAALDEPEDTGAKRGKARPKRATRAQSVASTVDGDEEDATPRRNTRAATASERGSPTPSVASSAASPSAHRRRTRAAASTSTRVTRSRK